MTHNNDLKNTKVVMLTLGQLGTIIGVLASLIIGLGGYIWQEKEHDMERVSSIQNQDHESLAEIRIEIRENHDEIHELKTMIEFRLDKLEKKV